MKSFLRYLVRVWRRGWMQLSWTRAIGPLAARLAGLRLPAYKGKTPLARLHQKGYISPTAKIGMRHLKTGRHIFIGDRVVIHERDSGGDAYIGDCVYIHQDTIIEVGNGGSLFIDGYTHIQPRAQINVYFGHLRIGRDVAIGPNCAFFPYNHGVEAKAKIIEQSSFSKGGITIEDDVWLGCGVVVLDGVTIGRGSVIGAGSVVSKNIPPGSIAAGVPARVISARGSGVN